MRFLLDENVHPKVAEAAWEHDVDVVSVVDLRRRGLEDRQQLEFAADQSRVLVTRNRGDYLHWTREFYHAGRPHPGFPPAMTFVARRSGRGRCPPRSV